MNAARQQAIIRAAREEGVDPSLALAIAERESNFDPTARNSKSIRGMFQMTGGLRSQYGVGDSDDPYTQAKGWARFIKDERKGMESAGYTPRNDAELYAAHHFGARRAGRMFQMDPGTPVDAVFTPNEMAQNPHFAKAGTVGGLLGSVTSDIGRRQQKFGGTFDLPDLAEFGEAVASNQPANVSTADLSSFGSLLEAPSKPAQSMPQAEPKQPSSRDQVDLSAFGTPA